MSTCRMKFHNNYCSIVRRESWIPWIRERYCCIEVFIIVILVCILYLYMYIKPKFWTNCACLDHSVWLVKVIWILQLQGRVHVGWQNTCDQPCQVNIAHIRQDILYHGLGLTLAGRKSQLSGHNAEKRQWFVWLIDNLFLKCSFHQFEIARHHVRLISLTSIDLCSEVHAFKGNRLQVNSDTELEYSFHMKTNKSVFWVLNRAVVLPPGHITSVTASYTNIIHVMGDKINILWKIMKQPVSSLVI